MRLLSVSRVLVGILFLLSCRERVEVIKEVPLVHTWSLDSTVFGQNKFLLTSYKLTESKLLIGNSISIWTVDVNDLSNGVRNIKGSAIPGAPANWNAPALHQVISASVIDNDHLKIYPTRCPACTADIVDISADYSSATQSRKGFEQPGLNYGNNAGGYPVTSDGYILAPHEMDFPGQTLTCLLIKIDTSGSRVLGPHLQLNSMKPITINSRFAMAGASYYSACYYDKFFLGLYTGFFRIDKFGNVKSFNLASGSPQQMFMLNNRLFAVCGLQVYQSLDKGESWSLFIDNFDVHANQYYFNVGDELYATWQSQITRVTMIGDTLKFVELDNDGLQTNMITSINKCGKYAFATTTAGLFYRDTVDFNKPKEKK